MSISNFQREYGGMIWTNHAIDRLKYRHIFQSEALSVMKHPDKTFPGKKDGSVKFIRTINDRKIHLVASLNEKKQWVVLTAWVRGEEDQYKFPEKYIYMFIGWLAKQLNNICTQLFK